MFSSFNAFFLHSKLRTVHYTVLEIILITFRLVFRSTWQIFHFIFVFVCAIHSTRWWFATITFSVICCFPFSPLHFHSLFSSFFFLRWWLVTFRFFVAFVNLSWQKIKENQSKTPSLFIRKDRTSSRYENQKKNLKKKKYKIERGESNSILLTVHCVISYFLLCCIVC